MLMKFIQKFGGWTASLSACAVLAGCINNPHGEREMLAAPTSLSDPYTQAQLQFKLATTADLDRACAHSVCMEYAQFDERVARLGAGLAVAAYRRYPDLAGRVPAFDFSVVNKAEPGTGSTAGGVVVVLRPVASIARSDEALSFVLAREIGHVVAQHHEENTGTSLIVSLIATLIAPVTQVLKVFASVYSGTTAAASVSVTAASFASSKALLASYRPRQLDESDKIALTLLGSTGVGVRDVAPGFSLAMLQTRDDQWTLDLRRSLEGLTAPARSVSAVLPKAL